MKPGMGRFERLLEGLSRLNPRELVLLGIMILTFAFMIGFVLVKSVGASTAEIENEIATYQRAIHALSESRAGIARQIERAGEIQTMLEGEELQLHGFIERQCLASSVERPATFTDNVTPMNDPRTGQATLHVVQTIADISAVDPLPLSRLLNRIATAEELVFLRAIDLQPARGRSDQYRVRLTVTTYRRVSDS